MADDIVVRYIWDSKKIFFGLAVLQTSLLILAIWSYYIDIGLMVPKTDFAPYVLIGGGFLLYAFFSAVFIRMLVGDPFLTIFSSGRIVMKPLFREQVTQLTSGAEIAYNNHTVDLISGSTTEKFFERHGGLYSIRLPNGLKLVAEGRFRRE